MDHKSKNIDQYFREHLTGFEQSPPEAGWDIIARKLGHIRKKSIVLLFFRIAAGMALLLSTGIIYYMLTKPAGRNDAAEISIRQDVKTNHDDRLQSESDHNSSFPGIEKNSITPPRSGLAVINAESPVVSDSTYIAIVTASATAGTFNAYDAADANSRDYRILSMSPIKMHGKVSAIPVSLPSGLNYNRPYQERRITPEEATALLLADYIETDPETKDRDKWALGSEVAPLYSHRSVTSDYDKSGVISDLNDSESGMIAYAGGVRVAFSTGKRFSVQSGIYYSRYGQEKNKVETYSSKHLITNVEDNGSTFLAVTNSTGVISGEYTDNTGYEVIVAGNDGTSSEFIDRYNNAYGLITSDLAFVAPLEETDIKLTQYFDYFELPLLIKYKLVDRKIDFSFSGGLVTNILIGNTVNMTQQGETTHVGETTDINQVNYLGSLGMGLEYPISSGFALTLEPRFRYYLNPIDKIPQYDVHPYSFGIFAGISYVF